MARPKKTEAPPTMQMTAKHFIDKLQAQRSATRAKEIQTFFKHGEGDTFIGVAMGQVFALAKTFVDMPLAEIEKLLESPIHEARVGAVSVMDFEARRKKTPVSRRKELFDLYLRRHDRINNWDLVDRSAPYVVGGYLADKPRDVLYKLARSNDPWERRTAIVSTAFFIRNGDLDDTFNIAALLLNDDHDLIHKATGWMLRATGGADQPQLLRFLDQQAAAMPRVMLRYAIAKLNSKQRMHYLALRKAG